MIVTIVWNSQILVPHQLLQLKEIKALWKKLSMVSIIHSLRMFIYCIVWSNVSTCNSFLSCRSYIICSTPRSLVISVNLRPQPHIIRFGFKFLYWTHLYAHYTYMLLLLYSRFGLVNILNKDITRNCVTSLKHLVIGEIHISFLR